MSLYKLLYVTRLWVQNALRDLTAKGSIVQQPKRLNTFRRYKSAYKFIGRPQIITTLK